MELISREDALNAIKKLCMSDTPQMIWSTDAMDVLKKVPMLMLVEEGTSGTAFVLPWGEQHAD